MKAIIVVFMGLFLFGSVASADIFKLRTKHRYRIIDRIIRDIGPVVLAEQAGRGSPMPSWNRRQFEVSSVRPDGLIVQYHYPEWKKGYQTGDWIRSETFCFVKNLPGRHIDGEYVDDVFFDRKDAININGSTMSILDYGTPSTEEAFKASLPKTNAPSIKGTNLPSATAPR